MEKNESLHPSGLWGSILPNLTQMSDDVLSIVNALSDYVDTDTARLRLRNTPDTSKRILLVEDNSGDYLLIKRMIDQVNSEILVRQSFELLRASSLGEAQQLLGADSVDVVLLDLNLPDGHGLESFYVLKKHAPEIAIVVISGVDQLSLSVKAVYDGAQDYLIKGQVDAHLLCRSILFAAERTRSQVERARISSQLMHLEKLKSVGLFASGIAHDFNNLLTSVLNNIQLAKVYNDNPSLRIARLVEAEKGVRFAADLTRQVQAYSGNSPSHYSNVDLSDVVNDMRDLLRSTIPRAVELIIDTSQSAKSVRADAAQLRQVVLNLALNASDAILSIKDSGTVKIRTGMHTITDTLRFSAVLAMPHSATEYCYIEVEDDGSGIDEQSIGKLFDAFYSTKELGRGLGLSALWGIISAHEGLIHVATTKNVGSCFTVSLPMSNCVEQEYSNELTQVSDLVFDGQSVLVVDDEEMILDVVQMMLESDNLVVKSTKSGHEGIELVRESPHDYQFAILDLNLPDISALELISNIRKISPTLPLLLISGLEQIDIVDHTDNCRFLRKPFDKDQLMHALSAITTPVGECKGKQV